MAARRRYTAKERAKAVGIASLTSAEAASEQLGIPRRTIGYWMDSPEFAELRHKSHEAVAEEMWTVIQVGVREVAKGLAGDAPLRDKATAVGILYDKHALLTGGATGRMENRELNDLPDSAYVEAIREARRVLGGEGAGSPPEKEPAG